MGTVQSDYTYKQVGDDEWPNMRKVDWQSQVPRDDLTVSTRRTLGATMTLFKLKEGIIQEIEARIRGLPAPSPPNEPMEELEEDSSLGLLEDIQSQSREFIKDRITSLAWDEMEELVAGVLRAMGYKARVSPRGPDRGKDIVASPDGLGLEQPRIVVEVKHRKGSMGADAIRSFLGGRHKDDKGLYVSTGGFTKEARYEADRASIPLTLMDIDDLATVVIEQYENMDMDTRLLIPLVMIYWPA